MNTISRRTEKIEIALLIALAAGCVAVLLGGVSINDAVVSILAFPFAQIGLMLRVLSLSGGIGNIIAVILYTIVCLLPMAALFFIRHKRESKELDVEDALLPLMSALLFAVMFFMVNPGRVTAVLGSVMGTTPMVRMILGGTVYSVLFAYVLIRALRRLINVSTPKLGRYASFLLRWLNILFVIAAFGVSFAQMLESFDALREGNTGITQLGTTYVFLVMQYMVNALPYIMNIWVVFAALRLLEAFRADPYSGETVTAAEGVSRVCAAALVSTVLSAAGFNLLQLLFAGRLFVVNTRFNIPAVSVLFVLGALLLTRYIAQNKQIKDDIDQII